MKSILVVTPIKNIDGLYNRLSSLFDLEYQPDCTLEFLQAMDGSEKNRVHVLFTNPNRSGLYLGPEVLDSLPNLKVICTASTGTVHIDKVACNGRSIDILCLKNEIPVLRTVTSTAELAFTLMLTALRNILPATSDVVEGGWDCDKFIGRQVDHLTIGVIGYGRLGRMFARYCRAFGAETIIYDPLIDDSEIPLDYRRVESLEALALKSDVISLHVHVSESTQNMINQDVLAKCKPNLIFVNTSRGEIVHEPAMLSFLDGNADAIYATDVLADEIKERDANPIMLRYKRDYPGGQIIITPHIGGMTTDARAIAYNRAVDLLVQYIEELK